MIGHAIVRARRACFVQNLYREIYTPPGFPQHRNADNSKISTKKSHERPQVMVSVVSQVLSQVKYDCVYRFQKIPYFQPFSSSE